MFPCKGIRSRPMGQHTRNAKNSIPFVMYCQAILSQQRCYFSYFSLKKDFLLYSNFNLKSSHVNVIYTFEQYCVTSQLYNQILVWTVGYVQRRGSLTNKGMSSLFSPVWNSDLCYEKLILLNTWTCGISSFMQ